jgi:tetratricopeptide (TPR) repeat protein
MGRRQKPKRKSKIIGEGKEVVKAALIKFLTEYGEPESVQSPGEANIDSQLKSISLVLANVIHDNPCGTVIDIGAGKGILLKRLANIESFATQDQWIYLCVAEPITHRSILDVAFEYNLHRRIHFKSLENFYQKWPLEQDFPRPHLAFIRNVLHEINIEQTANLLYQLSNGLVQGEKLVLQDLAVFPVAEKGNACWAPEVFKQLLTAAKFDPVVVEEPSKSGNRWFSISSTRSAASAPTRDQIFQECLDARIKQWEKWKRQGALYSEDEAFRPVQLAKIDFDLQFAALTRQLSDAGVDFVKLTHTQESIILRESFQLSLLKYSTPATTIQDTIKSVRYFKNRRNSLTALEKFIESDYSTTLLVGPPLMGKTELVRHALSTFHHGRIPVMVEIQHSTSVWNLLESILSGMECNIATEHFARLRFLKFSDISDLIGIFFKRHAKDLIIVLDHAERIANPFGTIQDSEIANFLELITNAEKAKLIITSRRELQLEFLSEKGLCPDPQPPVARFPKGPPHVEQLLGAFVTSTTFPQALIDAIDRHPLMAVLTGLFLSKTQTTQLDDAEFLKSIRQELRNAAFARIVDDESRPAVEALSLLRIPVPRFIPEHLSSKSSLAAAEAQGVVVSIDMPFGEPLVQCLGALKLSIKGDSEGPDAADDDTIFEKDAAEIITAQHCKIARVFEELHREDPNPIWLREIYYHRMLSGDKTSIEEFGMAYRSEIAGSGEYWFLKKKDFDAALWAFQRAQSFGDKTIHVQMRIAACLIRTGKKAEGQSLFESLISDNPSLNGLKTSLIDSLLYLKEYPDALDRLISYHMDEIADWWIACQYGRAYFGMQMYVEAIRAFKNQIRLQESPRAYYSISVTMHRMGDMDGEKSIIEHAIHVYPDNALLMLAHGSQLQRSGQLEPALIVLDELRRKKPSNAWVLYPLIKALIQSGRKKEADVLFQSVRNILEPSFLAVPIEVELLISNSRYPEAISRLEQIGVDDEHSAGQLREVYYAWASSISDPKERRRLALKGLRYPIAITARRNVPVLISCIKLTLIANDLNSFSDFRSQIKSINPNVQELERLEDEARIVFNNKDLFKDRIALNE